MWKFFFHFGVPYGAHNGRKNNIRQETPPKWNFFFHLGRMTMHSLSGEKDKGAALKRLRKRARFSQQTLGEMLRGTGFTRQSIARWEQGQNWPEALEPVLEQIFAAPRGFFARIADGVSYEEALYALPQESAPAQETEDPQSLPITSSPPYLPVVQTAWRYLEEAAAANLRAQLALQTLLGPQTRTYSGKV